MKRIAAFLSNLPWVVFARDIVGLVGGLLIVVGVYEVYPPAALILGGVMLMSVAILTARAGMGS